MPGMGVLIGWFSIVMSSAVIGVIVGVVRQLIIMTSIVKIKI